MKLLSVDSIEEARRKLLAAVSHWRPASETVPGPESLGRTLFLDLLAEDDIPAFCRATVDGYAVAGRDTSGAGEGAPVLLDLAGSVEMGKEAGFSLGPGQCAYTPTGAMLPPGANAMVMIEYCEPFGEKRIALYESVAPGTDVIQAGEDARQGEILLRRGQIIGPQEIGVLAAAGIARIPVYAPLRLTLISTGDELVPPDRSPGPGEIRDVNTWALQALAVRSGCRIEGVRVLPDDEALLEAAVREALDSSDVIALSGGSSQGEKDMTAAILARTARPGILTQGIALKPGKPAITAYDRETETILLGLPGHPVSAILVFEVLLAWLVRRLWGQKDPFPIPAKISCNLAGAPGKTSFQPVSLIREGGEYRADPVFGKSGLISALTRADGFVVIDMNCEGLQKGEAVLVYPV
jgi:molybdopterin molybdotransferase